MSDTYTPPSEAATSATVPAAAPAVAQAPAHHGFDPAAFFDHNKNTIGLVLTEAKAIVDSGAQGAHTDQARRNYMLAEAVLGILTMLAPPPTAAAE